MQVVATWLSITKLEDKVVGMTRETVALARLSSGVDIEIRHNVVC